MKKLAIKKSTLAALIVVLLVAAAFGTTLGIVLKNNAQNRQNYEQAKIRICKDGVLIGEYTYDELAELTSPVIFQANFKPKGEDALQKSYSGILLRDLLLALGVDIESYQEVQLMAADGYPGVYTIQQVMEEDNVYIANMVEGELFPSGIDASGKIDDGGPYVAIRAKDAFSQFRVKMLVEINIV